MTLSLPILRLSDYHSIQGQNQNKTRSPLQQHRYTQLEGTMWLKKREAAKEKGGEGKGERDRIWHHEEDSTRSHRKHRTCRYFSQFRVIIHRSDLPLSSEPSRRDCALFRHTQLNCAQQWIPNPTTTREPLSSPNPSIHTNPHSIASSDQNLHFSRNRTQRHKTNIRCLPRPQFKQRRYNHPSSLLSRSLQSQLKIISKRANTGSVGVVFGARIDRKEEEEKRDSEERSDGRAGTCEG
ncbi:hypothetical protein BLNAU_24599 [Blattamonas nauphoetae]|uniref:Uncharacterized protein n=1 Tax=Blattamonas nauphoetae TaxID=2049346 RepID=A0ABQ9WLZ4_9EUKA|nr:hypothetical protein BLNAU_24599 [Blattamonas nauphoetae]